MATETPLAATRTVKRREVPAQGTWSLDPNHTTITFEVRHMMLSKARGTFGSTNGTIVVATDPLQSKVERNSLYMYRLKFVYSDGKIPTYTNELSVTHLTSVGKQTWGSIKALFR